MAAPRTPAGKPTKKASRTTPHRRRAADTAAPESGSTPSISESAQQIWLAGVGAFGRAQAEGTRLFEGLVKDGLGLEKTARGFATARAQNARAAVETTVGQTRERASETWERFEKVIEDRVQRTLQQLGVPAQDEVQALRTEVEALRRQVQARDARAAPGSAGTTRRSASRKAAAEPAVPKRATRSAVKTPRPARAPRTSA